MHTNKKPYIATKENINKYTVNRFRNIPIKISNKMNLIKTNIHQSIILPTRGKSSNSNILIMFDNDLNIRNRSKLFNSYLKVYLICNGIINYGFELSEKVSKYKESLIKNVNKLIPNSVVIKSSDLKIFLGDYHCIDVIYPGVGHNLDLIDKYAYQNKTKINYIYRDEDLMYWNYANSGFYKFKKTFYKLNNFNSNKTKGPQK
tara:strand:+ start:536 stop:1144 length:609 start_codon:yes stop_codon:yes gene_type:complete